MPESTCDKTLPLGEETKLGCGCAAGTRRFPFVDGDARGPGGWHTDLLFVSIGKFSQAHLWPTRGRASAQALMRQMEAKIALFLESSSMLSFRAATTDLAFPRSVGFGDSVRLLFFPDRR